MASVFCSLYFLFLQKNKSQIVQANRDLCYPSATTSSTGHHQIYSSKSQQQTHSHNNNRKSLIHTHTHTHTHKKKFDRRHHYDNCEPTPPRSHHDPTNPRPTSPRDRTNPRAHATATLLWAPLALENVKREGERGKAENITYRERWLRNKQQDKKLFHWWEQK